MRMLLLAALIATPAIAQTGSGAGSGAAAPTIQPMSGSGAVRQPPANSAMRNAGGGGGTAPANPMGMAGMGAAGSNALTLTSGGRGGSMMTGRQDANGRRDAPGGDQSVRITDTGVTQRGGTGGGSSGSGSSGSKGRR